MLNKKYLMVPGPTPVPERVLNAMNVPMINHRGVAYEGLFKSVVQDLKKVFNTQADILLYPAAGTGAMEASIVNLFSAGDKVLVVSIGVFGDRLAEIATSYGLDVEKLSFEPGQAIAAEKLAMRLQADINTTVGVGGMDLAMTGDFANMFKWGYAKEIPLEVIQYGDPDNSGQDLKGYNQVYLRSETYLGWSIMDASSFARVIKPATGGGE